MKAIRAWQGPVSFVLLALPVSSAGQDVPGLERGRALYQYHCGACHRETAPAVILKLPGAAAWPAGRSN
jgi:mono/diheme cytochrome c family protein